VCGSLTIGSHVGDSDLADRNMSEAGGACTSIEDEDSRTGFA
jgi:hypothetical protein